MFNTFDNFSEFLSFTKNFTSKQVKEAYDFINTFPLAEVQDILKAAKKIQDGVSIDEIKSRYKKYFEKSIGEKLNDNYVEVTTMQDVMEDMVVSMKDGLLKGSTTHIEMVDKAWKWRESEFTLLTGFNNDGKSLWIRYLALIKGIVDKWKTAAFAPEDFPAVSFFDDLIHTAAGYTTDKDQPGFIGESLYRKTADQIKDYFYFINIRPPKSTLENILNAFIPLIETQGIKICIIDPLVKITRPKEYVNADAQWAAYVSTMCTDFARRYNICLLLVLHQVTPKVQENGVYAKPDKYSIKNGGNFSDSSDNVLFLQRPESPRDLLSTLVRFGSLKIKKQKLVGIPQEIQFGFNRKTNRYVDEIEGKDLFDFDTYLDIPRMNLLFKP